MRQREQEEVEDPYPPSSSAISTGARGCRTPIAVSRVHRNVPSAWVLVIAAVYAAQIGVAATGLVVASGLGFGTECE